MAIPITQELNYTNYCENIPDNWQNATLYGSFKSFVITIIFENNLYTGVANAALSAVATSIHTCVSPIFLYVIGEERALTFWEEMGRGSVAYLGAGCVGLAFGNPGIIENIDIYLFIYGIFNYFERIERSPHETSNLTVY
ncbi:MAG: hypothetical protein KAR79_05660 [Simkaniaceae bacterium]|nr:hypothetical protein [Simkaniaceae bacterium]